MVVLVVTMVMVMCGGDGSNDGAASQPDNSTFSGVTAVLQWCQSGVAVVVLQWCHSGVTVVLQWIYSGITVVLQLCYRSVTVVLQWCHGGVWVTWPSMVGNNSAATV
jgi:hypothetical protein